ncbi:MAG: transposase, partial [Campylobacterales bacterium]
DAKKILELFSLQDYLPSGKRVLQNVKPTSTENLHLKRLTRRRRQLVIEKVAIMNRLGSDLQAISPGLLAITGKIDNLWFLRFLTYKNDIRKLATLRYGTLFNIKGVGKKFADTIHQWQQEAHFAEEVVYTASMIHEDALRILQLLVHIKALDKQIAALCQSSEIASRIMSIPGFGTISCAELAAEIGTFDRFDAEGSLALYVGMTNLDNSSGKFKGSKRSKQVNRHAKMAMINAVSKHIRWVEQSKKYYDKKRMEGKSHQQAVRSLGRHLIRVIWSMVSRGKDYEIR